MKDRARQKAGRGCFFYGCLTFTLILLVVAVGTFFGVRYAIYSFLQNYTETEPVELPRVVLSPDDMQELKQRLSAFEKAVLLRTATEPLILTEEELNALLAARPELLEWSEHLYIFLEEGQIRARISLPLDRVAPARFQGRYLNATADLKLEIVNSLPVVNMESATVKGDPVPERVMEGLRRQNLAGDVGEFGQVWRNLEEIRIEKGRALIYPAGTSPPPSE